MMQKRISAKIALLVTAVEIVSMAILYGIMSRKITRMLQDKSADDMTVIAKDRAELIETYIHGCCDYLDSYSKADEIVAVLQNPSPANIQRAREYTNKCADNSHDMEGLYVARWDTYVLAHNNPNSVDKTFRDAKGAHNLEAQIRQRSKPFCSGIVMAPVTKKMVIPVYAAVRDKNGEQIGFAGAAFMTNTLEQKLSALKNKNTPKSEYLLINAANNTFIFHSDSDLVGTVCSDPDILQMIQDYKYEATPDGKYTYSNDDMIASCHYIKSRNWYFIITDSKADVFKIVKTVRAEVLLICAVVAALTVLLFGFFVERMMKPLSAINNAIVRFKKNDFSEGHSISRYFARKDEFGTIANAVNELKTILQNQDKLFKEMFQVQTVGTVVTAAANGEIMLINKTALELYGFDPEAVKDKNLTVQDVRNQFTKEELEAMESQLQNAVNAKEGQELTFETSIHYADGRVGWLLTHTKRVTLSNDDHVVIYSVVDITAQKKMEINLQILSETDYLTSICNRRSGEFKISNALGEGKFGMFCLFDVNKFKFINDSFGHAVGDKVLVELAGVMKKSFRNSDILIRLGGDEFAVFAPGVQEQSNAMIAINRFMQNVEKIDLPEMNGHKVTVSMGCVFVPAVEPFGAMYEKADSVMYECKKRGGNAHEFYKAQEPREQ